MKRIIKIATNNIEVTPSKTVVTIGDKTVEIWDEENTQSYGQDRLDREVASNATRKDFLNAFDPIKDKADKLTANQEAKDELILIQEAMDE